MQFLVTARDYTDADALNRRMAAREAHLATIDRMVAAGSILIGAALLDEQEKMVGSTIIVDMPDREAVDAWLREEPFVVNKVWETVTVTPCRLGPAFHHLLKKQD